MSNNDSYSDTSAKPRKKSRVATGSQKSGGTKSIGVSRWLKVAKVRKSGTGRVAAKGKKTLDYGSDDFSSSSNDSTPKATMGKQQQQQLRKLGNVLFLPRPIYPSRSLYTPRASSQTALQ